MPKGSLKRYLITGLLIWVPIGVTLFVINILLNLMDKTLVLIPEQYRPDALLGFHIPGLGLILAVVLLFVTGVLATNILGRKLVQFWEGLLARIPLVRSVYSGAKQVAETMFSGGGKAFSKAVLIPYPNRESWSLAFVTSTELGEVQAKTGRDVVGVFVPTTPNPTSGFNLMIPREDVIELEMTVDEALRMIISLGVIVPPWPRPKGVPKTASLAPDEPHQ